MSDGFLERLVEEIARRARVDVAAVQPETHLIYELGLSSLDLLSVLAFVEQELEARFPDEVLRELTTVSRIEAAVREYRVSPPAAADEEGS